MTETDLEGPSPSRVPMGDGNTVGLERRPELVQWLVRLCQGAQQVDHAHERTDVVAVGVVHEIND